MPTTSRAKHTSSTSNGPETRPAAAATSTKGEVAIFDLLMADHRLVAAVFDELKELIEEDEPDAEECLRTFAKIDALLTPHARAEERLIYPAFAEASEEAQDPVAEGFEEHALVHLLCAQIKELPDVNREWCAKAKVMMDLVEHHVREEEGEQFTAAREGLSREEALDLAAQFEAAKMEIGQELGLPPPDELELPRPKTRAPAKA